ncbi:MAG: penicillin-binding transpeptidase domain-containing protein [Lachnospiraceae bacterium]|nr:penicillin-binding transpeptidase domain-containing protein [Lachnospiraceae bacterium]MDD3614968.1 penicillin-binding transpeptidase domain-containing protein [Lachnospiraceae bacterium]
MTRLKKKDRNNRNDRRDRFSTQGSTRYQEPADDSYYEDEFYENSNGQEDVKKKKRGGKEYAIIAYVFVAIFISLIGWMVYFNVYRSAEFINSPYNKRQNTFADRVVRGDLLSSDGEVLATTQVDEEGNETRVYPYENMFAHVIGYASNGKSGLESEANFQLLTSHDFILTRITNEIREEKNLGDNVVTTLDSRLQSAAYSALGDYNGAVVVLEPSTGKVLAMVSKPTFNPNTIESDWDSIVSDDSNSVLVNRVTQGLYPPGSTFKIVTTLAYLREHGSLDGFSYDCSGTIQPVDGNLIHCYDSISHGAEDLPLAFENSCNCAFCQIGLELGHSRLNETANDLMFNSKLPLDITYNQSQFNLKKDSGDAYTMLTSIGQGDTLVTPMHMAMIVSSIANGGTLMKPYLIDHVENVNGDQVSKEMPDSYKKLMTSQEAATLSGLMEQVVTNGTASGLAGQGYTAAGKTGSAEYYVGDEMHTHSWFVGFSNVENPDLVVAVIAEGAGTGSSVAVPIARDIFNTYYSYS